MTDLRLDMRRYNPNYAETDRLGTASPCFSEHTALTLHYCSVDSVKYDYHLPALDQRSQSLTAELEWVCVARCALNLAVPSP